MRKAVIHELCSLAERDERVMLLTADLGFNVVEEFADRFPDRFVNVGVAEANMMNIAAGLALRGLIPHCYSIATFASMRGYEQLRNGAVQHGLRVCLIGVGGGFGYGSAGPTHWALEDIALMRAQPGLAVMAPATDAQAAAALRAAFELPGPAYLRLAKDSLVSAEVPERCVAGATITLRRGTSGVALLTTGAITLEALSAASLCEQRGVTVHVLQLPCIAPLDIHSVAATLAPFDAVLTVEEHYPVGGLGSLASEAIAAAGLSVRVVRIAAQHLVHDGLTGSERWLRARSGLDAGSIAARTLAAAQARPRLQAVSAQA